MTASLRRGSGGCSGHDHRFGTAAAVSGAWPLQHLATGGSGIGTGGRRCGLERHFASNSSNGAGGAAVCPTGSRLGHKMGRRNRADRLGRGARSLDADPAWSRATPRPAALVLHVGVVKQFQARCSWQVKTSSWWPARANSASTLTAAWARVVSKLTSTSSITTGKRMPRRA